MPAAPSKYKERWAADQDDWIKRITDTQNPFIVVAGLVLTCTFGALTSYDGEKMCPGNPHTEHNMA